MCNMFWMLYILDKKKRYSTSTFKFLLKINLSKKKRLFLVLKYIVYVAFSLFKYYPIGITLFCKETLEHKKDKTLDVMSPRILMRSFWNLEQFLNMVNRPWVANIRFFFKSSFSFSIKKNSIFYPKMKLLRTSRHFESISCQLFSRVLQNVTQKHRKIKHLSRGIWWHTICIFFWFWHLLIKFSFS